MNAEIEKLIKIAKESGSITQRQKELILKKANTTSDADIDEVEIILDSIPLKDGKTTKNKVTKCPNCGAVIPSLVIICPECGFRMNEESASSSAARESVNLLEKKLFVIENSGPAETRSTRKAMAINTLTMPNTLDGLTQLLVFSYNNFEATNGSVDSVIAKAWLSKAVQAYKQLSMQIQETSPEYEMIEKYSFLSEKDIMNRVKVGAKESISNLKEIRNLFKGDSSSQGKSSGSAKKGCFWICIITLIIAYIMAIPMMKKDAAIKTEINELMQDNNFDAAKLRSKELSNDVEKQIMNDEILEVEINFLLDQGNFDKARIRIDEIVSQDTKNRMRVKYLNMKEDKDINRLIQ